MARIDNLVNLNDRTPEEARAIRAAGGRAAAKAKANNNKLRHHIEMMLNQQTGTEDEVIDGDYKHKERVKTDGTYYDRMVCALLFNAISNHDTKAIVKVLDILSTGESDN